MNTKKLTILDKVSKKDKLYFKMNTVKSLTEKFTFVRMCEHIGEAHLFEWICLKALKNEHFLYYHDAISIADFELKHKIKPSTQHKYLKLLVTKGLVDKKKNGVYTPNSKYLEFK